MSPRRRAADDALKLRRRAADPAASRQKRRQRTVSMCVAHCRSQADDAELRHGHHGLAAAALSRIGADGGAAAAGGFGDFQTIVLKPAARIGDEMD